MSKRFWSVARVLMAAHACTMPAAAAVPAAGRPAAPAVFGQTVPALRVTAPNGATSILIASLHVPASRLRQPAASVLDKAKRYVVESVADPKLEPTSIVDMLAPEVLTSFAVLGKLTRAEWARPLTESQTAILRQKMHCNSDLIDPKSTASSERPPQASDMVEMMLGFKSARHALAIAAADCAPVGILSRDGILQRAAAAAGVPTVTLESAAQVEQRRRAVPEHIYRNQFYRVFTAQWSQRMNGVVDALNSGHYDAVALLLKDVANSPADAETYDRLMVSDRNRAWMPSLTGYLDQGNAVVNVGAAHLPGPAGLIVLLKERGYKLETVGLPAGSANK